MEEQIYSAQGQGGTRENEQLGAASCSPKLEETVSRAGSMSMYITPDASMVSGVIRYPINNHCVEE